MWLMKVQRKIDKRLIEAARAGSLLEVQALVAQGADVNAREGGYSALTLAANHYPVFTWLLDHGADLNYCNSSGWDAILCSLMKPWLSRFFPGLAFPSPTKWGCGCFINTTEQPGFAIS